MNYWKMYWKKSEEQKLLFEWRQLSRRLESLKDIVQHWLSWKETKEPKGSKEPSENTEHTDTDKVEVERVFWLEKTQCQRYRLSPFTFYSNQYWRLATSCAISTDAQHCDGFRHIDRTRAI